jgi:hypothetical protein
MGILDLIGRRIRQNTLELLDDVKCEVNRKIILEINRIQRKIMVELSSLVILMLAIIFLAIAAIYFLIEYLSFSKTISFLTVGIVILLIGLITRITK